MAVKIRMTRLGRKNRPFYRIVVIDSRAPRNGRYIECVGTYSPIEHPPEIKIDEARALYWLNIGAVPSDTVSNLLQTRGILYRNHLAKKGLDEKAIDEEMKKWEVLQIERQRRIEEKATAKSKKAAQDKKKKEGKSETESGSVEAAAIEVKTEEKAAESPTA